MSRALIAAIERHPIIGTVDNCPQASITIANVIYGKLVNDNNGKELTRESSLKDINNAIWFGGISSETAVWHFSTEPAIHHFVVVPWHNETERGRETAYTVFMAYENQYILGEYINKAPGRMAQQLRNGYKPLWTAADLATMLQRLLSDDTAWSDYFLYGTNNKVTSIKYYKYDTIAVSRAITNLT